MSKRLKSLLALLCIAAVMASCLGVSALAAGENSSDGDSASQAQVIPYTEIPMYVGGKYIGAGIMINSVTYVPLLSFTETMLGQDLLCHWCADTSTPTLTSSGISISVDAFDSYMTVNDRCFYLYGGVYNLNGTVLVSIRDFASIFSLGIAWDGQSLSVSIDASTMSVPVHGSMVYNQDDLYWLSRVINSESGNQPMAGMIGVGNVVLNRANDTSGAFSDGIYGVIFQEGQFSVVDNGTIYKTPSDRAVAAAKMCLEGCNTVGDCKWFLNPSICSSRWFDTYKTLTYVIADHAFYA